MTGECLRYEKGGFQSGFMLSSRTNILQILMMALFWKYVAALPGLRRAHGKLHCFRRTTHSRSGDIQVGMGMSYRITRSGNLHSNALKSAPLFWATTPSGKALFLKHTTQGCVVLWAHDGQYSTTLECWEECYDGGQILSWQDGWIGHRWSMLNTISHPPSAMCWNWL